VKIVKHEVPPFRVHKATGQAYVSLDGRRVYLGRADANISISYMYCTGGAAGGKTVVVLKVTDIKKATKVLEGIKSTRRDMKIKLRRPAVVNNRR